MDTPQVKAGQNILIVDDNPTNLHLLSRMLSQHSYQVKAVNDGMLAIEAAHTFAPDLILLDINMPDMDGYEVCERLKADEKTRPIPIIFISALNDTEDKVKAFTVGGVDYVSKPFQIKEVLARVETHMTLKRTTDELEMRIQELDAFSHTVAHDLKGPLNIIMGYTGLLEDECKALPDDTMAQDCLRAIFDTSKKMNTIIEELMLLAGLRKVEAKIVPLEMGEIVAEVQSRLRSMLAQYEGTINLPDSWPTALGYAPWVEEAWINYMSNALKYGGRPPVMTLGSTVQDDGFIRFWVHDNGPGLTQAQQERLFMPFERLEQVRVEGHGLGLSIVRRILEKLNGQAGVESEVGQGSVFYFTLPAAETVSSRIRDFASL